MTGLKCKYCLIVILSGLFSLQAFPQKPVTSDSIAEFNHPVVDLRTGLHYSLSGTFLVIPHLGSVSGYTFSPYLSVPLSPKLSVEGGIIAGRYFSSLFNSTSENALHGSFNQVSLYGSASYHCME